MQENDHHQDDEHDRLADRLDHGIDRLLNELRGIEENVVLDAGGKTLRQLFHQLPDGTRGLKRIGTRPLKNRERDRRIVIKIRIRRIIERGQLDLGDVSEPNHGTRRLFDHDRREFFRIGQAPESLHRDLEGAGFRDRRLIEDTGGDLDVLTLQARW